VLDIFDMEKPERRKKGILERKYTLSLTKLIFLYDHNVVIDLSQITLEYSSDRTYTKDGKLVNYNFCLDKKIYPLYAYNSYLIYLLSNIAPFDQSSVEEAQSIGAHLAYTYTEAAWLWYCNFNVEHPKNETGNYISHFVIERVTYSV
jgi:hypothetical protein